jgi:hypothetical protein
MAPPARYAEGTEVPVERSRAEIETLLTKHGATAFFAASDSERGASQIGFRLAGRLFRLEVRKPRAEDMPRAKRPQAPIDEPPPRHYEAPWPKGQREKRNAHRRADYAAAIERLAKKEIEQAARWVVSEERRRWRAQVLLVKAKLEMIATGETTVEREFLADMLMPDSRTVGQAALPAIAEMYRTGKAPTAFLLGAGPAGVVEGEIEP